MSSPGVLMLASLPRYAKASARDLEEVRLRRLKRVLHHAYDHVPYHRDLFDRAGIRPEDVRSFADLQRVPVTTRADLQRTPLEQLTADNVRRRVNQARTGGSTGVAITIVWAPREGWIDRFNTARSLWLNGWHPPQSILKLFWRFPTAPYWSRKLGQIGLHMPNLRVGEPPDEQLARMREMRPLAIFGYASYLGILAQTALEKHIEDIRPRLIVTTADMLSERNRSSINAAFGCDPLQLYGCVELGTVAWECRSGRRIHVHSDLNHLELLQAGRPAAPGEMGEITCTSLFRFAMPLIRYQPGDLAVADDQPCSCGLAQPTLRELVGRTYDVVRLPSGRLISARVLDAPLPKFHEMRAHRITQVSRAKLVVEIVPGDGFSQETEESIKAGLTAATEQELAIEVRVVQEIPTTAGGKQRVVVALPID